MKTLKDLEKEFDSEFVLSWQKDSDYIDSILDRQEIYKFLRTAIKTAFEETGVNSLDRTILRPQLEDYGRECFNQALTEINKRQEEFLKE